MNININCYLGILVSLLAFFCAIVLYLKYKDKFVAVPNKNRVTFNQDDNNNNVYQLDSRYEHPNNPPVNPITKESQVINKLIPSDDLYTPFNNYYDINNSNHSIIDNSTLNELNYSGGSTKLIKIPLQMNEPNHNEQLRSQNELITPYNKIKYC